MGRIDPLDGDSVMHPALPLSLAVAATAATIAIITSVCAFWRTEPQDSEDSPETAEISSGLDADGLPATEEEGATTTFGGEDEEANEELPRPPCMRALTMTNSSATAGRCSSMMKKSASSRRISSALSVKKHFRSISVREIMDKNKLHKPEESLCKKPIMLGGKCKVGGQVVVLDDDEDDDYTALKTQTSSQNPDAIADKDEEEEASFKPLHY